MPEYSVGFVYVLSNESVPRRVKIGMTRQLAEDRAKALFTTSLPTPFDIEHREMTSLPEEVEARAHELLAPWRVNKNREFFEVSLEQAIDAVRQANQDVAGIDYWHSIADATCVRRDDRIAFPLRTGQYFLRLTLPSLTARHPEITDIWQVHGDGDLMELMGVESPADTFSFSERLSSSARGVGHGMIAG